MKYLVLLTLLLSAMAFFQEKTYRVIPKLKNSRQWYPYYGLRRSEKTEISFVYTKKQEFRNEPIIYNYSSVFGDTKLELYNYKDELIEKKDIPFNRTNLYYEDKGFADKFSLRTWATDKSKLSDGYYYFKLTNVKESNTYPIVYNNKTTCDVVVVASTNTWNIYNDWYNNFYAHIKRGGRDSAIGTHHPYARPYTSKSLIAKIRREYNVQSFLDKYNYNYCLISNRQYDQGVNIANYRAIILPGHSEYWSTEGKQKILSDINRGVSVISLSGNNMFRDIEYYEQGIRLTRVFSDLSLTSKILGTYYWFGHSFKKSDQAGFKITDHDHWAFNQLGANAFGNKSIATTNDGYGKYYGASAHEIDQIWEEGHGFKVIARGENKNPKHQAELVIKELPAGQFVANFSSMAATMSLVIDPGIDIVVRNMIDRALKLQGAK